MQFLLLMRGTPAAGLPGGGRLRPPIDATTLRGWGQALAIEPGSMLGSAESILDFSIIDAPDLEAAIVVAARDPWAAIGDIEVRAVWADFATAEEVTA